ncbi:MAG TPA: sigma-70 family RNA polymerase sigma factor [Terracidiphilus sp.]
MMSIREQDRQISDVMAEESSKLRNFIRGRAPRGTDVEDLLQEVFYELVRAHRLLMPIDTVSSWLFRVARNRITDLFRKRTAAPFSDLAAEDEDGTRLDFEGLLPSREGGPDAQVLRNELFIALNAALAELPLEQREVFLAHEVEGRSFNELSAETGIGINTLLSRKRYAVLALRKRLEDIHREYAKK